MRQGSPTDEARASGQLRLRMPVSLHEQLAHEAAVEGVSLNQFICSVLAAAVRWKDTPDSNVARDRDERVWAMWRRLLR